MAGENGYVDQHTSYDSAIDQLLRDGGFNPEAADSSSNLFTDRDSFIADYSLDKMLEKKLALGDNKQNLSIERAIGDTLKNMQDAPTDSPEHQAYQQIVQDLKENDFLSDGANAMAGQVQDTFAANFADQMITQNMSVPRLGQMVMEIANVPDEQVQDFKNALQRNPDAQENIRQLINVTAGDGGQSINPEQMLNSLESTQTQTFLQNVAENAPAFMKLAQADSFDSFLTHVQENGFTKESFESAFASLPTTEKIGAIGAFSDMTPEQLNSFQNKLDQAIEQNPALEGHLNELLANSLDPESPGEEQNIFAELKSAGAGIQQLAEREDIQALLDNPHALSQVSAVATDIKSEGQELTGASLQEGVVGNLVGQIAPILVSQGKPWMVSMIGKMDENQLKEMAQAAMMNDQGSQEMISGSWGSFGKAALQIAGFDNIAANDPQTAFLLSPLITFMQGPNADGNATMEALHNSINVGSRHNGFEVGVSQNREIAQNVMGEKWDYAGNVKKPEDNEPDMSVNPA